MLKLAECVTSVINTNLDMKKVYSKDKDNRYTSSLAGQRISKSTMLIEIYGNFDELNSFLGFAAESLRTEESHVGIYDQIRAIQKNLMSLVARLNAQSDELGLVNIDENILKLEREIMAMSANMPELTTFVLPADGESAARLHLARVVCRRTERVLVRASEEIDLDPLVITYINRLSDWLFVAARMLSSV